MVTWLSFPIGISCSRARAIERLIYENQTMVFICLDSLLGWTPEKVVSILVACIPKFLGNPTGCCHQFLDDNVRVVAANCFCCHYGLRGGPMRAYVPIVSTDKTHDYMQNESNYGLPAVCRFLKKGLQSKEL